MLLDEDMVVTSGWPGAPTFETDGGFSAVTFDGLRSLETF